jgi:hypothetical protein
VGRRAGEKRRLRRGKGGTGGPSPSASRPAFPPTASAACVRTVLRGLPAVPPVQALRGPRVPWRRPLGRGARRPARLVLARRGGGGGVGTMD